MDKEENRLVAKSNELINASYNLTLRENQILTYAIASIVRTDIELPSLDVDISLSEFKKFYSLDRFTFKRLYSDVENLYNNEVIFYDGDMTKRRRWLSGIDYNKNKEEIKLIFSSEILPFLTGLSKDRYYTLYALQITKKFKSKYSFAFFELLAQTRNMSRDIFTISNDVLRKKLHLENKYKAPKDLRIKVIEPILKDMNNCTKLSIDSELIKKGRSFSGIQIIFKESKQATPPRGSKKKTVKKPSKPKINGGFSQSHMPFEAPKEVKRGTSKMSKAKEILNG